MKFSITMHIFSPVIFTLLVLWSHGSLTQNLLSDHHVPKIVSGNQGQQYVWLAGTYKLPSSNDNQPSVYI